MRTVYKNHSSALAALLLLPVGAVVAGCGADSLFDDGGRGNVVVVADIDNGHDGTRTCIDPNTYSGNVTGVLWTPDDSLGVFGTETLNAPFRNVETSAKRGRTSFTGTLLKAGEKPQYAYYPYSKANDGRSVDNLLGTVHGEQTFSLATGQLSDDWKYGTLRGTTDEGYEFKMKHLFAMAKVDISATGTALEGQQLDYITLTVTPANASSTTRRIHGDFTFNATNATNATNDFYSLAGEAAEGDDVVKMTWSDRPQLTSGAKYTGYLTLIPNIHNGDQLTITVATLEYAATYKVRCKVDFQSGSIYTLPLALTELAKKMKEDYGEDPKVRALPAISAMEFTVADNSGKLLDNKLTWNSSNNPQFDAVSTYAATVKNNEITLTIPYLHDFSLVPRFSVGEGCTVTVGGVVQESGKTAVDFTHPVTYTVTNANGDARNYEVRITNTGLPVVVIKQSKSGDFSEVKQGSIFNKVTVNEFVNFMIRGKDTDWVEDDQLTVYNPDGSVDVATAACGVRLRGNTSQAYPKKPFAVKFVAKQSVLGMPSHKRWVLLANWLDHSMIRNAVAFDVAHAIEKAWKTGTIAQGIPWNVHGQNVELIVDGHHVGNYYLCEQIKIGGKRLNIQDAYEDVLASGVIPTFENCGYLMELDNNYDENCKFITTHYSVPFMLKDDVTDNIIFSAVKSKVQGIEDNIYNGNFDAAYNDLDINSVIDQWLIWELTMNHEFLDPRSVYYFMDGNGKLSAGPVWDFDRATFQNVANAESQGSSGDRLKPYDQWICWSASPKSGGTETSMGKSTSCIFYPALVKDATFQAKVKERWAVIYPYLQAVVNNIRAYGESQAVSFSYDSKMWPTTKAAIQKHKSGFSDWSGDENIETYPELIENFVEVYQKRLDGMNTLITNGKFTK